jgi:ubiquinone biosynthesis protein UbiJ
LLASPSLASNLLAALNWAIEKDEALHEALRGLAGKKIAVVLPFGVRVNWALEADGLLHELNLASAANHSNTGNQQESFASREPDVVITVAGKIAKGVRIEGAAAVVEKLAPLGKLVKERVSPWEQFWANSPPALAAKQLADYAIYEANLVTSRQQAASHLEALRELKNSLDRLEKRIERLENN